MLTIRTCPHIRTSRHHNFRACAASTGVPLRHVAASAALREEIRLSNALERRAWIEEMWRRHGARIQISSGRKVL